MPKKNSLKICAANWLLILALVLASYGCQRNSNEAVNSLADVDQQHLVQRGQIQFLTDSTIGRQLAKQQGRPCLLFFTAEWCTYCHQMEEAAFADEKIQSLAKNFVCVMVDADREPQLCQQLSISGYPTVQFLAADGRQLHRLVGRQPAPKLAAGMQAALERLAWLDGAGRNQR